MKLLWDDAKHWKIIAVLFGFDEDLIDEIDTNDETDEACLRNCVEHWVARLGPTWEKIELVQKELISRRMASGKGINALFLTDNLTC